VIETPLSWSEAAHCDTGVCRGVLANRALRAGLGSLLLLLAILPIHGESARGDGPDALRISPDFIAGPAAGQDRDRWLKALRAYREGVRDGTAGDGAPLDLGIYDLGSNRWIANARTCHFTFLYDRSLYDPETGRWQIDAFLDDGEKEFGGYDILLLWQAYPRLGFGPRNQFDFYHDLPGGLDGVADLVRRAQARGVKVFTNYNPWDTGTRRTGRSDEDMLVELVEKTQLDGIFLDTLDGAPEELRQRLEAARPGIALCPELKLPIPQLATSTASWAQWLHDPHPPGLLHLKWIAPRHMQYQIRRWDLTHRDEIRTAFFNGSGMMVWENIFGAYNPWNAGDRRAWRRAVGILRRYSHLVNSDAWDPFFPPADPAIHIHRWPGEGETLFTVLRDVPFSPDGRVVRPRAATAVMELPHEGNRVYYDLWNGQVAETEALGENRVRILAPFDREWGMGAILAVEASRVDASFLEFLAGQFREAQEPAPALDTRNRRLPLTEPEPVTTTALPDGDSVPPGMVSVPGGRQRFHIAHERREAGCYPDPGSPADTWGHFTWGHPHEGELLHAIGPLDLAPYFIDEAAVTNADYRRFLEATGYRPRHPENFLKHWPDGVMPAELADHPVVYVDLDDARAYARWAGKRLPTEYEWQLAAQGPDGLKWPWGDEFDPARVNQTGATLPARALPEGRSPYGCYQMGGNVWELTESLRDDGHTRFLMLRGGSYYRAEGSGWYVPSGPQPCDTHTKFIRLWPGLDRSATIGFRCAVDAAG